jgi:hypothetical protein
MLHILLPLGIEKQSKPHINGNAVKKIGKNFAKLIIFLYQNNNLKKTTKKQEFI